MAISRSKAILPWVVDGIEALIFLLPYQSCFEYFMNRSLVRYLTIRFFTLFIASVLWLSHLLGGFHRTAAIRTGFSIQCLGVSFKGLNRPLSVTIDFLNSSGQSLFVDVHLFKILCILAVTKPLIRLPSRSFPRMSSVILVFLASSTFSAVSFREMSSFAWRKHLGWIFSLWEPSSIGKTLSTTPPPPYPVRPIHKTADSSVLQPAGHELVVTFFLGDRRHDCCECWVLVLIVLVHEHWIGEIQGGQIEWTELVGHVQSCYCCCISTRAKPLKPANAGVWCSECVGCSFASFPVMPHRNVSEEIPWLLQCQ